MKGRIGYIDAMRGFTMLLVVFGHVASICVGIDDNLSQFFLTFRMPLFFFISGFIGYKCTEAFTWKFYFDRMKLKGFVQIVPVSIFIAITCIFGMDTIKHLYSISWGGWWFTLCLLEMFVIYYSVSVLCNKVKCDRMVFPILFVLALCGVAYLSFGSRGGILYSPLIIENLTKYFQWFVLGLFVRKHFNVIESYINNHKNCILTITMVIFWSLFMLLQCDSLPFILYKFIHDIAIRYFGLFVVFLIFYSCKDTFDRDSKISRILKFIGGRTLDIYLLHNFFLSDFSFIKPYIEGNVVLEFFTYAVITILIVVLCLSISCLIRKSSTLAYFCFGVRKLKK